MYIKSYLSVFCFFLIFAYVRRILQQASQTEGIMRRAEPESVLTVRIGNNIGKAVQKMNDTSSKGRSLGNALSQPFGSERDRRRRCHSTHHSQLPFTSRSSAGQHSTHVTERRWSYPCAAPATTSTRFALVAIEIAKSIVIICALFARLCAISTLILFRQCMR